MVQGRYLLASFPAERFAFGLKRTIGVGSCLERKRLIESHFLRHPADCRLNVKKWAVRPNRAITIVVLWRLSKAVIWLPISTRVMPCL